MSSMNKRRSKAELSPPQINPYSRIKDIFESSKNVNSRDIAAIESACDSFAQHLEKSTITLHRFEERFIHWICTILRSKIPHPNSKMSRKVLMSLRSIALHDVYGVRVQELLKINEGMEMLCLLIGIYASIDPTFTIMCISMLSYTFPIPMQDKDVLSCFKAIQHAHKCQPDHAEVSGSIICVIAAMSRNCIDSMDDIDACNLLSSLSYCLEMDESECPFTALINGEHRDYPMNAQEFCAAIWNLSVHKINMRRFYINDLHVPVIDILKEAYRRRSPWLTNCSLQSLNRILQDPYSRRACGLYGACEIMMKVIRLDRVFLDDSILMKTVHSLLVDNEDNQRRFQDMGGIGHFIDCVTACGYTKQPDDWLNCLELLWHQDISREDALKCIRLLNCMTLYPNDRDVRRDPFNAGLRLIENICASEYRSSLMESKFASEICFSLIDCLKEGFYTSEDDLAIILNTVIATVTDCPKYQKLYSENGLTEVLSSLQFDPYQKYLLAYLVSQGRHENTENGTNVEYPRWYTL